MAWNHKPWSGVFAATLCPFREDQSLDESGLREYISELAAVDDIQGLVCNGHTGEAMSLLPEERAKVTAIGAETAAKSARDIKVASGVMAEGILEATELAHAAKSAGADAILLMPPHHWLRFGRTSATAISVCHEVSDAAGIDVILHQYPSWTKASYSLDEMLEIAKHPRVVMIKMGTRDMSRWLHDFECLKKSSPETTVVTCHDEFLLPTLFEAADGALIGFAGFAPRLMVDLVHSALNGDFARAKEVQKVVAPLARLIYNFGEPGCGAHQRMKVARWLLGKFPSPHFRRPVMPLPECEVESIRTALADINPQI
jgi:4-hydroxy-tetrahydrodipicolinate synthase